jgi:glutamate racemase
MKKGFFLLIFSQLVSISWAQKDIKFEIVHNPQSPFYIPFAQYPTGQKNLPVGVFDSGTGGLTVFNALATFDEYNNKTGQKGSDGILDFSKESFIYLADQANMPYGNYAAVGKTDLLREHILKDAQFMLGSQYFTTTGERKTDKSAIKALVIACNTATAYGKEYIEEMLQAAKSPMKVIGVIDAGARGALALFEKNESGSIGVFATAGTVSSGGYVRALEHFKQANGYVSNIQVHSQGGVGLAEAIDEDASYIDKSAQAVRSNYKGPSLQSAQDLTIDKQLMKIYNFDFVGHKMLCDAKNVDDCSALQINDADNYVRYHLVSLLENMRKNQALPMKAMILGCTHYPYMSQVIERVLTELRNYQENGQFRYRHLLAEKVHLIDPSVNTARELYQYLQESQMQNTDGNIEESEFYISIPNTQIPEVGVEANGTRFTYAYKYGRSAGENKEYVWQVPFSKQNIFPDIAERLNKQIPAVFRLISTFNQYNKKLFFLNKEDKF